MKNKKIILLLLFTILFSACANTDKKVDDSYITQSETIPTNEIQKNEEAKFDEFLAANNDPLEPLNRRIYYFNYLADKYAILPIVNAYEFITPIFVQNRVTNFFRNIKVLNTTANAALQMKGRKSMRSLARLTINTVLGLGGLFDVASKMGMPKPYEDFGLTLAHYGVPKGPYLILPFFGPSYLRGAVGIGAENLLRMRVSQIGNTDLPKYNMPLGVLYGIDKRKNLKFRYYETGTPFEYEYLRFLFTQYRKLQEETGVQMY